MNARKICELAAAAALFLSLQAAAQEVTACTSGGLERTVEVVYENPGEPVPCEVRYTKSGGVARSLWSAEREGGYCEQQAAGLVQKLADSGWSCEATAGATPPAEPNAQADSEAVADAPATPQAEPESESEEAAIE